MFSKRLTNRKINRSVTSPYEIGYSRLDHLVKTPDAQVVLDLMLFGEIIGTNLPQHLDEYRVLLW